ncbi:hypothetical protein KGF56_004180 [Candida oxycetoniae]|uniref:Zn(2)-C6 fungal-type domain-containing protein n=1 Tax=Candida oxycetoniae TaxID=497107 RepID=A0AAI9SU92_9ASCO|nr:uncharacterized protein KGF56_004180 [Candida oxycetoniae]KAI3402928.2 hypothetical protein KGF56_004180 [Candida oxycetoniae]
MSTGILDLGLRHSVGKRIYSKGGCRECKRRKIKCSEGKPSCFQCSRLKKECSYPEAGERVLRVSRKKQKLQVENSQANSKNVSETEVTKAANREFKQEGQAQASNFLPTGNPINQLILTDPMRPPHPGADPAREVLPPREVLAPREPIQTLPYPPPIPPHHHHHHQQQQQQQQQQLQHHQERVLSPIFGINQPAPIPNIHHAEPNLYGVKASTQPKMPRPYLSHLSALGAAGNESLYPTNRPEQDPFVRLPLPQITSRTRESTMLGSNFPRKLPFTTAREVPNAHEYQKLSPVLQEDIGILLNQSDLSVLANDLNNMVNGILYEKNTESKVNKDKNPSIKTVHITDKLRRDISIDFIKLENENDQVYLEEFYHNFSKVVLPFPSFDSQNRTYFNPARNILLSSATNSDYVLAALLACGAHSRYLSSGNQEDEDYYYLYLLDCVKLLGPAIADDRTLGFKIESVLLTVLLLAAANAANSKQDWRPHLKGAKDLLRKISVKKLRHSKVTIFCKCWFVTLEILAGISSNKGGTLTTDDEIQELITSGSEYEKTILTDLGIILDNGFNIMGGYHNDCYDYFCELLKILNKKRQGALNPSESMLYIKLFANFQRQTEVEFINKTGVLQRGQEGILVEQSKSFSISWMDICHQLYVQASMITLLSTCFEEPFNSPQIQVLTDSLMMLMSFTKEYDPNAPSAFFKVENGLMMLQWPARVAGSHLIKETDKNTIRNFFQVSSQVGSGGALIALKRVERIWAKREDPSFEDDGDESEDLVSY